MKELFLPVALIVLARVAFCPSAHASQPPPPAERACPPQRASCGEVHRNVVRGETERTTIGSLPCPVIRRIDPAETHPRQWLEIHGDHFGDSRSRIGDAAGEKRVMMMLAASGGIRNPLPVRMEISRDGWSSREVQAQVPDNIAPGRYQVGIFYESSSARCSSFGLVSNMVRLNILR